MEYIRAVRERYRRKVYWCNFIIVETATGLAPDAAERQALPQQRCNMYDDIYSNIYSASR